ncbi:lysophosphatidic acid phosphatase type 6-like isoform X2 [Gigantopelta aegis]|nr:lysophosphatidic acid phosphatase type 6-like isoform X2 [Gigantopelta aegis]XP_041356559.1 lysophosphatidic acid phosphatase type 6-like isoform X2 [Gigantopelta aegis]
MDNTPVESSSFDYQYRRTKLKGGGHAGMLTSYGQDQMYLLGRQLRYDYINTGFLCPEYNEEQIFVRSTNMKRTIDSARCVLAGLYTAEELNKTCSVKIVTSPSIDEVLFPNNINCPVVKDVINATMVDFDNIPGIKEDRMKMESALGLDSTKDGHKLHFVHMRDDLTARMAHGWMVPKVVLPFMDLVEENATKLLYFAMCGKTEEERKTVLPLSVGPALTMSVKMMEDMMNGKSQKMLCLYSTHDSLMICLLEAFGLYNNTWPEYAADFRLELYEDRNQEFWVKVRYCGQDKSLPPCSESMFSFDQFSKMMKPYVKEKKEYLRICNSNILKNLSKGGSR